MGMGELRDEKLDVAASPPCCPVGALSHLPIIFAIVIQNGVWSRFLDLVISALTRIAIFAGFVLYPGTNRNYRKLLRPPFD
jgi:hypothetical protein